MSDWTPTGRTRHRARRRLFGREELVLQIELRGIHTWYSAGQIDSEWGNVWRDATTTDLLVKGKDEPCA